MGDLRLRARDEEAEQVGRDCLVGGRELAERLEQVVLDDLLCASESLQAGHVEPVRPGLHRRPPEPVHHELEERSLDGIDVRPARPAAVGAFGVREPTVCGRVDHRVDERRLES